MCGFFWVQNLVLGLWRFSLKHRRLTTLGFKVAASQESS